MKKCRRGLFAAAAVLLTIPGTPAFGQSVPSKPADKPEAIAPLPVAIPNLEA
jgi:hypothetical protein